MDKLVDQPVGVKQRTVSSKALPPQARAKKMQSTPEIHNQQTQSFTIFRHSYSIRHQPNDSVLATCFQISFLKLAMHSGCNQTQFFKGFLVSPPAKNLDCKNKDREVAPNVCTSSPYHMTDSSVLHLLQHQALLCCT